MLSISLKTNIRSITSRHIVTKYMFSSKTHYPRLMKFKNNVADIVHLPSTYTSSSVEDTSKTINVLKHEDHISQHVFPVVEAPSLSASSKTPENDMSDDSFSAIEKTHIETRLNPYADIAWQILVYIVQNGFSIFFAIMIIVSMRMQMNAMNKQQNMFGKNSTPITSEQVKTRFSDVAGCDNAKMELQEVVDFLKSPEKYNKMGATIPKGCLLTGGPGLGKTLLAKAVAGEANVPFFACSASEFIELFVGVGSARVRELFKKAKESAPCIIFIDEIDAIGKSRSSGGAFGGSNEEREQTINQLLTEMDGFTENPGIVVLAATNRPEILDQALIRPGRFDRQIMLDPPKKEDREAILRVHCANKPLADDVNLEYIASLTIGFSGAELANIANEAAIVAARRNNEKITSTDFLDAIDRVMLGPENNASRDKTCAILVAQKKLVACHEAGHAVVALVMDPSSIDKVTKVSIVSRGKTGGVTVFEPLEEMIETGLYTREYLQNKLVVALGGRAAEEIVYGEEKVTTGASNDMEVAQQLARSMICSYGFGGEAIGNVSWSKLMQPGFPGGSSGSLSQYMLTKIDKEVVKMTGEAYERAKRLLNENEVLFTSLAKELYQKEVLDRNDVERIVVSCKKQPRQTHLL